MSRDFNLLDRYLDYLYLSYLYEIMMTSFRELGNYTKCIVDSGTLGSGFESAMYTGVVLPKRPKNVENVTPSKIAALGLPHCGG